MEWIEVKKSLPEDGQKVIFYVKDRDECFCGFFSKNPPSSRQRGLTNIFYENLDGWWFEDEHITHWTPLFTPPKD